MEIISELNFNRVIHISTILPPTPAVWQLLTNTENVVLVTPEADVWEAKTTNTGGVTQKRTTWVTNTPLTFDLVIDTNDAVQTIVLTAIATRTKLLFNVTQSNTASDAYEFAGYVQSATDDGTDGGGYRRSVTVEPCGSIDEGAIPAVVI